MTGKELQRELRAKTNEIYSNLEDKFGGDYVPFKAIVGNKYPSEKYSGIAFYGRCNNGWDSYTPEGTYKERELKDFFFAQSPFLNLMYWEYWYFYKDEWMDYTIYNNVAKMVPEDGGNCSDDFWWKQYDGMKEIIRIENDILLPKFTVLVLGNTKGSYGWEKPFKDLGFLTNNVDTENWEGGSSSIYKSGKQYFILTDRPERKKIEPHAEAIWNLMDKAEKGWYK